MKLYQHIDKIADIKAVENKVKSKEFILRHGFYPFLSNEIDYKKFSKDIDIFTCHHWKIKSRPIKYASHIDRYIYQWYSHLLNNDYNNYCLINELNEASIAYRTCLVGQTNIEFASKAINFVKSCGSCYVLVSDFSSFFDTIEHNKLKENIQKVMNLDKLSPDFYKVFKSMTKYSYIEKKDIENYLITSGYETKESLKKKNSLFDSVPWKSVKKDLKIHINNASVGIPQGSPLSGIFANVYMIDFDERANEYARSKNGLYMRYSDDLIMIIPKDKVNSIKDIWNTLDGIKKLYPTLKMNINKTNGYLYENKKVKSLHHKITGMQSGGTFFCYLGFSFDGEYVKFRDKTLTKFFYKQYRLIDDMCKREYERIKEGKKRKTKIDKHRIMKRLTFRKGINRTFVSYVYHAKRVFPEEKYIVHFLDSVKVKMFERFEKNKRCRKQ